VLNGNEVSISASLGIAIYSDQYENHFDILRDADIAMYQAKKNSFRRYEVFQPEMRYKVESRLKMETDIRRALQSNEFELYYQPILSVKDLNWVSSEALIRWHNPIKGMISPTEFIPIAEETGLIIPLGRWVIREVCKQITTWKSIVSPEKNIVVSINLSAKQFSDPRLCEEISGNLIEYQLEGKNLVIEVTESTIIEEQEKVVTVLSLLRRMGIQVHIDDFGTGYSSLSYLQMLPFDAVKIDRSFINQMSINCDKTSIEIIQTIISLSKELRKTVIAEGVETQGELDLLANMDCEYFQGFLVSKPMGQADATKYLKKEADGSQLKLEQFSALTKFQ
jgi:EAL domain-containing protein (putative c-di-GMP-specific phosphodiesterase class I)